MKRIAQGGLFVAVALVLSLIEKLFPLQAVIPIPGIKLGLANVVTLFALTVLGTRQAVTILLCRVTLAAIFMGSITGFLFSLFGGLLALLVMRLLLLREGRWFSLVGISIGGAAAHNIGQIAASAQCHSDGIGHRADRFCRARSFEKNSILIWYETEISFKY